MFALYNSAAVAVRIKEMAKMRGITAKQVLADAGLGNNMMSMMRTSMPKADNLAKIADQLGCSVDYLLGRVGSPESNSPAPEDPFVAEFVRIFAALSPADQSKAIAYLLQLQRGEG